MMNCWPPIPGRVVRSKMGRDAGRWFIIKEVIDENYVFITDGALRRVDSPKRKKLKHLELKADVLEGIAKKLCEGAKVFDGEIKSALRDKGYSKQED